VQDLRQKGTTDHKMQQQSGEVLVTTVLCEAHGRLATKNARRCKLSAIHLERIDRFGCEERGDVRAERAKLFKSGDTIPIS
jgi:hypothetical protein